MDLTMNWDFQWILVCSVFLFLILILCLVLMSTRKKLKKLSDKYDHFMNGEKDFSIEQVLTSSIDQINDLKLQAREFENHFNHVDRNLARCCQKVAIVRFNAFADTGSDLSFAIAILDDYNNGFVISAIYARESSTTYAKPIEKGSSRYPLSAEEIQALDMAQKNHGERFYQNEKVK